MTASIWLLGLCLAAGTAIARQEAAPRPTVLLVHEPPRTGGEREALDIVRRLLGIDAAIDPLTAASLPAAAGPQAGEDSRSQAYTVMRARGAAGFAIVTLQRNDAILRVERFDGIEGVRARRGVKIRSLGADALTAEHRDWLKKMLEALTAQLDEARAAARHVDNEPYPGTVVWQRPEVPPVVGFRWKFAADGPRVTFLYDGASIVRAGLAVGDRLIGINEHPVPTPPLLGRAVGPLRPGAALRLRVERDGKPLDLAGRVESAAELIPPWQKDVLGEPLAEILGAEQPEALRRLLSSGRTLLLLVFSPRMPDTWESLAVLRWLLERYGPDRLAVAGLARGANRQQAVAFTEAMQPGWPVIADPDGALAGRLRVWDLPELFLADSHGVLRYRQIDEAHLRQAIDTLGALE